MAQRGGKRNGAGRPSADKRGVCMSEATRTIDLGLSRAVKALSEAMDATVAVPKIVGRDDKGHPVYEYIEKPDHNVRVKAAKIWIDKRIPDIARIEHTGKDGGPIEHRADEEWQELFRKQPELKEQIRRAVLSVKPESRSIH